jgi:hypothetical protein
VLEGASPVSAMRRSWNLVQGSWWRIFGIFLLTYILIAFIGNILKLPFNIIGLLVSGRHATSLFALLAASGTPTLATLAVTAIGGIVATTCTAPISAGVIVLLYADARMRKEGLDLALQQAGQAQSLTGQEFSDLWQPGLRRQAGPGSWSG